MQGDTLSYLLEFTAHVVCAKVIPGRSGCSCGQQCHDDDNLCCFCQLVEDIPPTTTTTTTTPAPKTTTTQSSSGGVECFPGVAKVHLENGNLIQMSELKVGDLVQTGL